MVFFRETMKYIVDCEFFFTNFPKKHFIFLLPVLKL